LSIKHLPFEGFVVMANSDTKLSRTYPPIPSVLSQWLSVLLNQAAQETRDLFNHYLESLELTAKEFAVLSLLRQNTYSQVDLGRALDIDRTTMVALIDSLEQHGFVERQRHPSDRRQYIIVLTTAGTEAFQKAEEYARQSENEFLAPLTDKQKQELRTLLHLLLQARRDL
jgi:DNA-binding MarR family transcriptional regulator